MSKYTNDLIQHIETNPSFIEPEQYRNNILARLKKEGTLKSTHDKVYFIMLTKKQ